MSGGDISLISCLVLFLVLWGESQGINCTSSDPCPANRPRDPRGCCPGLRGDRCGYTEGEEEPPGLGCDSVLGYDCVTETPKDTEGTCQGLFSLEVNSVEQTSATIAWEEFKPENHTHEYSLLRREHTYTPNITDWLQAGIGYDPRYELVSLRPGTWYFVRIGVWADIESQTYANLTETLVFFTKPVDYCMHDQREYPVGVPFEHNCEDRCTCLPNGEFECEPLCDIPVLPDPRRCELQRYNESSCCAVRVVCQPLLADCVDPDSEGEYEHGEEFETECSVCVCNNGTIHCEYTEACQVPEPHACPHPEQVPVLGQCCPQWRCGNGTCTDDRETYNSGDTWHKESTCQTCNCSHGSVTCEDLCEEPITPENCSRPILTRVEGSCCQVIECRPAEGECFYENKAYKQGLLTNTQCELCRCAANSTVVCQRKECQEVHLPLPSVFCPHPHIRNDGCCNTTWCQNPNQELISVIKKLFGHSYSPHSVTVSFETEVNEEARRIDEESDGEEERQRDEEETNEEETNEVGTPNQEDEPGQDQTQDNIEEETNEIGGQEDEAREEETGTPDEERDAESENSPNGDHPERTYELQYMSSDLSGNETWRKWTFKPEAVGLRDEPVSSPAHFLQTTSAIRVGKRVFVTVSGMEANTTYYLKVLVLGSGFKDGGTRPRIYAGAIAVQTLAEDSTANCPSTCKSRESLVLPSPSCPKPVVIQEPGTCCPVRKCYPEEGGCYYDNLILKNGEQIREHCERACICRHGNVTCTPVCGQPGPSPREGCALKKLTNHCCSLWMCPPRSRRTEALFVVVSVMYAGVCQPGDNFTRHFKQEVVSIIQSVPACSSEAGLREECERTNISLVCPQASSVYRRRRDEHRIRVDIHMQSNISSDDTSTVGEHLAHLAASVSSVFNSTNSSITVDGTVYYRAGHVVFTPPTGVCDAGFIYVNDICVEGVTPTTPPTTLDVPLHVSATSTSAILAWTSLQTPRTHYVTGLQIEYQEEEVLDAFSWNQTDPLDPGVTSHELTSLQAARGYRARLVVFTSILDNRRVRMRPVRFQTKPFERTTMSISISLQEVSVSVNSVILRWAPLQDSILREVDSLIVRYSHKGVAVLEDPAQEVNTMPLRPSSTSVTISQLTQSTAYVAHLAFFFKNNTMAKTGSIHFVTMTQDGSSDTLVVALLVSITVVVCAVAVVLITCCLWKRNKQQEARQTAFENKTFLHIENDGRILSVRP